MKEEWVYRTAAQTKYGLTHHQLKTLECRQVPNPHVPGGKPSTQYRLADVLRLSGKTPRPNGYESIRQLHPNSHRPWTQQDDDQLKDGFARGLSAVDMAPQFQRKPSAIQARLFKWELVADFRLPEVNQ